jgi:hypothetical protein
MVGYKITIKNKDDAVKAKSIDDLVIEQFCLDLISAQEYFNIDLMPEIMAIAKKIAERKDK